MKKFILVLSLVALFSCSSENDRDGVFVNPQWIIGTWKKSGTNDFLTFTNRDIIYNSKYSFSRQAYNLNFANIQIISSTENVYIVDYFQNNKSMPLRFSFFKVSATQMSSKGHLAGNFTKE